MLSIKKWYEFGLISIFIYFTVSSSIGNGVGEKPVKMAEIEKNKIQVSIKVGYELYVPEVSDLGIDILSEPL